MFCHISCTQIGPSRLWHCLKSVYLMLSHVLFVLLFLHSCHTQIIYSDWRRNLYLNIFCFLEDLFTTLFSVISWCCLCFVILFMLYTLFEIYDTVSPLTLLGTIFTLILVFLLQWQRIPNSRNFFQASQFMESN